MSAVDRKVLAATSGVDPQSSTLRQTAKPGILYEVPERYAKCRGPASPDARRLSTMWELLQSIFGDAGPPETLTLAQIAARAVVVYLMGLTVVRIGKSRALGRVTSIDVLLGFILGSILGRGITGHSSIPTTTVATATLVFMHWLLTWAACRSHVVGNLLKGKSKQIVSDGAIDFRAMRSSHVSIHDLEESMRLHGVENLADVHQAYKERNGEISVVPRRNR